MGFFIWFSSLLCVLHLTVHILDMMTPTCISYKKVFSLFHPSVSTLPRRLCLYIIRPFEDYWWIIELTNFRNLYLPDVFELSAEEKSITLPWKLGRAGHISGTEDTHTPNAGLYWGLSKGKRNRGRAHYGSSPTCPQQPSTLKQGVTRLTKVTNGWGLTCCEDEEKTHRWNITDSGKVNWRGTVQFQVQTLGPLWLLHQWWDKNSR